VLEGEGLLATFELSQSNSGFARLRGLTLLSSVRFALEVHLVHVPKVGLVESFLDLIIDRDFG